MRIASPSWPLASQTDSEGKSSLGRDLSAEAAYCREEAVRFAGRPEQAMLVKLAHAFETLCVGGAQDSEHRVGQTTP